MNLLRRVIGFDAPLPAAEPAPPATTTEDAAKLLRAQRLRLAQKEQELATVGAELNDALASGDISKQRIKLQRKRDLEAEIRLLRGKIANQASVADTLASADSDLQQARVLKHGAQQLENIVQQSEKLDIDDIVDRYQDNAKMSHEFGSRLSEPLFSSSAQDFEAEDIDDELARMQEAAAIQRMAEPVRSTETPKSEPAATLSKRKIAKE